MKEAFIDFNPPPGGPTDTVLQQAIVVVESYQAQGYALTLRQLYYQMVTRNLIPNELKQYTRLSKVVSDGRKGGWIDWDAIVDRGRIPVMPADWTGPAGILRAAINSYRIDRWQGQAAYVEVWCEKDALSSILEPICARWHVRMLANRGYSSSTAMYDAAKRFDKIEYQGRNVVVIYLGDHDPSGMDMSRDIRDRLDELAGEPDNIEVSRIALNWDQIQLYSPPPNPAKFTDSRAPKYVAEFGSESWELDALEPQVLDALVTEAVTRNLDIDLYNEQMEQEDDDKHVLRGLLGQLNNDD